MGRLGAGPVGAAQLGGVSVIGWQPGAVSRPGGRAVAAAVGCVGFKGGRGAEALCLAVLAAVIEAMDAVTRGASCALDRGAEGASSN